MQTDSAQIEMLYKRFEPHKVADMPALIQKYGVAELLRMVKKKYKAHEDVAAWLKTQGEQRSTRRVIGALVGAVPIQAEWLTELKAMKADGSWPDFLEACQAFGDSEEEDESGAPPPEPTGKAAAVALQNEIMTHGASNVKKIDRLRRASLEPDLAPASAGPVAGSAPPPPAAPPQMSPEELMAAAMAEVDDEEEDSYAMDISSGLATATFTEPGSLGMRFTPNQLTGAVEVLGILPGKQALRHPQVKVGMMLTALGGTSVAGMTYADVIAMVKIQGRPLTMVFAAGSSAPSTPAAAPPSPTGKAAAAALQNEIMTHGASNVKKIDRLRRASLEPDLAPASAGPVAGSAPPPPAAPPQMSPEELMAAAMAEVDDEQAPPPPPPPEENDPPPPPPPEDEGPPEMVRNASATQMQVEALYKRYNPEKVSDVPNLMKKYGEDELLRMVSKKYTKQEKRRNKDSAELAKFLAGKGVSVSAQKVIGAFDSAGGFPSGEWLPTLHNMNAADFKEFIDAV